MNFLNELKNLKEQLKSNDKFTVDFNFDNIVISGMGGSGIVGNIFQEYYTERPVISIGDYGIPSFVNEKTLFIAVSYSGNTEETISNVEEAKKKGAHVMAITSGGKLETLVENPIIIPSGLQPRSALGYMLMPLYNTFSPIDGDKISAAYDVLNDMDKNHGEMKSEAFKIYENSSIPIIYGSKPFKSVAYRWKTQFNENAKTFAFYSYFPELNHNDTMPLKSAYRRSEYLFYAFESDNARINQRIKITQDITGEQFTVVKSPSNDYFVKLFYLIHYADYLTYELALVRNVDPTDVSTIEELKAKLS
ncbi:MAG: bifunctional phosphoglucose/phosphomannose isomerase [Ferroplasma sp.]|uniref:bifunctional phosphoglucose/phosphomannose isomerase n=1 Tax=Ferroplasma sp. TaxID=2591003 RepID=UPI0028168D82|nr:bifunctional phosphoglucose/phosphomannose isomerase [Ferroplasma sp.]WMT50977.1 MAG: bifunctional phosphoglucose/phosphomannose isomerase [Ferroplasma sp.]